MVDDATYAASQAALAKTLDELSSARIEAANLAMDLQAAEQTTKSAIASEHAARLAMDAHLKVCAGVKS